MLIDVSLVLRVDQLFTKSCWLCCDWMLLLMLIVLDRMMGTSTSMTGLGSIDIGEVSEHAATVSTDLRLEETM